MNNREKKNLIKYFTFKQLKLHIKTKKLKLFIIIEFWGRNIFTNLRAFESLINNFFDLIPNT